MLSFSAAMVSSSCTHFSLSRAVSRTAPTFSSPAANDAAPAFRAAALDGAAGAKAPLEPSSSSSTVAASHSSGSLPTSIVSCVPSLSYAKV